MRLDDLIRETHKTALLQQKESGAALLLLQASIRKRNPDTSASASAAIVPGLLLALLVLASSKVGKSHDVGHPYTHAGSFPVRHQSRLQRCAEMLSSQAHVSTHEAIGKREDRLPAVLALAAAA